MENAKNILSQAIASVNTTPSYTKIRYIQFGEDLIYYVGNMEQLTATSVAVLQDRPSPAAQNLSKICLEQIKERNATLLVCGDITLAASMAKDEGNVVLLLACGIKKVNLSTLMPGIRAGKVLVISLSVNDTSDNDSIATANRLLAALCYCGVVIECQGGSWNSRTNTWTNHVLQKCEMLHNCGKSIFIAPWHRGHPAQHLIIKHEFGAIDMPESGDEDPKKIFSFIPEDIE